MKRILFEMNTMSGEFQLYVNYDGGVIEYEVESRLFFQDYKKNGELNKKQSKMFLDLIDKAKIKEINEKIEMVEPDIIITDSGSFSVSSFEYGNALWPGYKEIDNCVYIYLAEALCDNNVFNMLISDKENEYSPTIKEYIEEVKNEIESNR